MSSPGAVDATYDEAELVARAQKGDRSAFVPLIEKHYDSLYRWLFQITRDPYAAEDLVQETFLKAFANLKRFQPGTNLRAWLFRIAHNNQVNQHRSSKRQKDSLPADLPTLENEEPHHHLEQQEALALISQAIADLPEQFRTPFMLRVYEECSFREIAAMMSLTEETARWRVHKARQLLMSALQARTTQEKS